MKKLFELLSAFILFLSILSGVSVNSNGIRTTAQNVAYAKSYPISVVSSQLTVKHGNAAAITIKGKPNSRGYISVYYGKNKSNAQGLNSKVSNKSGYITWAWIVGSRTHKGTYHVYATLGGKKKTANLYVK